MRHFQKPDKLFKGCPAFFYVTVRSLKVREHFDIDKGNVYSRCHNRSLSQGDTFLSLQKIHPHCNKNRSLQSTSSSMNSCFNCSSFSDAKDPSSENFR